jgi:hypothetical protein
LEGLSIVVVMLDAVLGERQSAFEQKAQRVLRAVEKVRAQILAKTKSQRFVDLTLLELPPLPFHSSWIQSATTGFTLVIVYL